MSILQLRAHRAELLFDKEKKLSIAFGTTLFDEEEIDFQPRKITLERKAMLWVSASPETAGSREPAGTLELEAREKNDFAISKGEGINFLYHFEVRVCVPKELFAELLSAAKIGLLPSHVFIEVEGIDDVLRESGATQKLVKAWTSSEPFNLDVPSVGFRIPLHVPPRPSGWLASFRRR